MKAFLRSLLLVAALVLGTSHMAVAQDLVSTGLIAGYQPKEGTLTIRSDQTNSMITFFGVDKAQIFTSDGKVALMSSLPLGAKVTVQYAVRQDKWYVSKVILPPENTRGGGAQVQAAPAPVIVNAEPSNSRAAIRANDGDITTSSDVKKQKVEPVRIQRQ